ncbi:MAG: Fic family protein [Desulfobacterales bacterium]|nr:Fic family protein [Desulfobacterales bacterium]
MQRQTGRYQRTAEGYRVFIPFPLPPDPPLKMDPVLTGLLSRADRALGRLDGLGRIVPDPELFISMFVKKEALLSSRIEGAQCTLPDLFEYESKKSSAEISEDLAETVNYIAALRYGMKKTLGDPLSIELILKLHSILLIKTRGNDRSPGEFRDRQVGIGPPGSVLGNAEFLPPPPEDVSPGMDTLLFFIEKQLEHPPLVTCGLFHCQFETIHPFRDGNGRIGRLLIPLILAREEALSRPLLYLSHYFLQHRAAYYEAMMGVRERGDWEGWMKFFLRGVTDVSDEAVDKMEEVLKLKERDLLIARNRIGKARTTDLLELFYRKPMLSVNTVSKTLNMAFATANNLLQAFVKADILTETTQKKRNRMFAYPAYIDLLNK